MSAVRPEFGPTLPELAGPAWRRMPRPARIVVAAAVVLIVAGLAALALRGGEERRTEVVRGELTFNLVHPVVLARVAPRAGELLRLERRVDGRVTQQFSVRAMRVPAYQGDINGLLPAFVSRLVEEAERSDPAFALRGEGRVRVNELPGYAYWFQTRIGGRTTYGRRLLLFAEEPGVRLGADVLLLAERSESVPRADGIGNNGALKTALRSLRLGTERP